MSDKPYKYHQAVNIYNGKLLEEFKTLNTSFTIEQGKIAALISEEELEILQNGGQTWYSKYHDVEMTVDGYEERIASVETLVNTDDPNVQGSVIQRLESKATSIKTSTDGIFASIVDVLMVMNDATATSPVTRTVTIDNHDFNITASTFESRISHMETITSGSLGDEATILEWAQSAIEQSARNITLSVQRFAVTDVVIEYAVGTNRTNAPTTGWSTATPTWEPGKYIWQRTGKVVDGVTTYSNVVCIQGAEGAQGPQGSEGARGETGKGIRSTKTQYILADFNVLPTPDYTFTPRRWYDTPEEYMTQDGEPKPAMKYYWTRVKTVWTDNSVTYSDPVYDATISDASKWSYEASIVLADSSITAKVEGVIAGSRTVLKRADLSLGIDSGQSYFKVRADSIDLHGIVTANGGFRIDSNGSMTCTGATINGSVTANDGKIGGWDITNYEIISAKNFGSSSDGVSANRRVYLRNADSAYSSYTHEENAFAMQQKLSNGDWYTRFEVRYDGSVVSHGPELGYPTSRSSSSWDDTCTIKNGRLYVQGVMPSGSIGLDNNPNYYCGRNTAVTVVPGAILFGTGRRSLDPLSDDTGGGDLGTILMCHDELGNGGLAIGKANNSSGSSMFLGSGSNYCFRTLDMQSYNIVDCPSLGSSDERLKYSIKPYEESALDMLTKIPIKSFKWRKDASKIKAGIIAQDLEKIAPELVFKDKSKDHYLNINLSGMVGYLVKAVQELNDKIEKYSKLSKED